jgi:cyanophycinase
VSGAGVIALVGGNEWTDGCTFDRDLLSAANGAEVLVLPTAAAYEHPQRAVDNASAYFAGLGGSARGLMVLARPDAENEAFVQEVRAAKFVYLAGGSPLHLRSVLKDSPLWDALVHAFNEGAVIAGSSAGAMVLCDPMVDPRGGAFTLGLGLVEQLAVIPHHNTWSADKEHRTLQLAPAGLPIVGIDEATALIRWSDGSWAAAGAGDVEVFLEGASAGMDALPS